MILATQISEELVKRMKDTRSKVESRRFLEQQKRMEEPDPAESDPALLKALEENKEKAKKIIETSSLFNNLRKKVKNVSHS